jgi:hypothetical protein
MMVLLSDGFALAFGVEDGVLIWNLTTVTPE